MTVEGIDVSSAQGDSIDWPLVAGSGRQYAILKATDGESGIDSKFLYNASRIDGSGLLVGAYHFFQPNDDAREQARHFARTAGHLINWRPMIDIETLGHEGRELPIDRVLAFGLECIDEIEQAFGQACLVYTFSAFWNQWPEAYAKRPLFIAHYGVETPHVPKPWTTWKLHQYAANAFPGIPAGSCPGVKGPVDCSRFNGTKEEFDSWNQEDE